jgi:parvulin-like peptidyl-prolyl isomerase
MIRRAIIFITLLSALCCCSVAALQNNAAVLQDAPAAPTPPPAKTVSDVVVLRISGEPVTEDQVLQTLNRLASQQLMVPDKGLKRRTALYNDAIDSLTTITLLKADARLLKIAIDKTLIDQQLQAYAKQYSSEENFQKMLAKEGITESQLRKNIEVSMSIQKVLDLAIKDAPGPTEEDLMKYYSDNPRKFDVPLRVTASQILLRVEATSTPEQKAEIKKRLDGIRDEIENKKQTFADAARKYSQDPATAQNGGDLGAVIRNPKKPAEGPELLLENALFGTPPGALSSVVEAPLGYRIFEVREIKPAGKQSFEEAKPVIRKYLEKEIHQKAIQKYAQELKEKATIETFMTEEEFFKRHPERSGQ